MSEHIIEEGDSIVLVFRSHVETPLGPQAAVSEKKVGYNSLLLLVGGSPVRKKNISSPGIKFSRYMALVANAIRRDGVWSNGASIDLDVSIKKLYDRYIDLSVNEYKCISIKSLGLLIEANKKRPDAHLKQIISTIRNEVNDAAS